MEFLFLTITKLEIINDTSDIRDIFPILNFHQYVLLSMMGKASVILFDKWFDQSCDQFFGNSNLPR